MSHLGFWVFSCPVSAAAAQSAYAGVMFAVMSAISTTTVACLLGSRKTTSFDIRSLISLCDINNLTPLQIQVAVGGAEW